MRRCLTGPAILSSHLRLKPTLSSFPLYRALCTSSLLSSSSSAMLSPTSSASVPPPQYDFDLVVLGGGSGGLAAAKEATRVRPEARVAVFDLVQPSVHGTRWGLGGTCVNVGCIPKKLMHHAATMGSLLHQHAPQFGWQGLEAAHHDWPSMAQLITDYIKSLNFSYRVALTAANVRYMEAYASFTSPHSLRWEARNGKSGTASFASAIIATGGRPSYLDIPGKELAITSDDVFWLKKAPGKTLVIGAGYIALETASFLHHLGHDVSVMVRGEILRKMDRQAGQMIGELMERDGVRFLHPASPLAFRSVSASALKPPMDAKEVRPGVWQLPSSAQHQAVFLHASGATETVELATRRSSWTFPAGPVNVDYSFNDERSGVVRTESFDTVLLAVGRQANVAELQLESLGIATVQGKVLVDAEERTTLPHVFAIGDVAIGVPQHLPGRSAAELAAYAVDRPELTPVAIESGLRLARRLLGSSSELMQYQYIPSTVFTSPSEYAFVGLSEEQAARPRAEGGIGAENVRVFYSRFGNIEVSPLHPDYSQPRSSAFTGSGLWSRRYALLHELDWPEVAFDTELNAYVVYTADGEAAQPVNARVINKYRDDSGRLLYDIQLEDGQQQEVRGVQGQRLQLQPEQEAEAAAVFVKANCLAKLVCDASAELRVVGLHFVGPAAGEVVQGFSLALQLGARKRDFDSLIGIHPTAAEEFAVLTVDKTSGQTPLKKAGCGGGSCG